MDHRFEIQERRRRLQQQKETLVALQSFQNTKSRPSVNHNPHSNPHSYLNRNASPHGSSSFSRALKAELNVPPSSAVHATTTGPHLEHSDAASSAQLRDLLGDNKFSTKLGLIPVQPEINQKPSYGNAGSHNRSDGAPLQFHLALRHEVTENRPNTAIKFHTKFNEILVTSHDRRSDQKLFADPGVIAIWNLDEGRGALQRALTANAAISAMELPSISPTLIIAGTTSGSILFWDTRMKTALPINALDTNTTAVTSFHDNQKVTALKTTTVSSPFFVSASNGGHVCKWTLSKPEVPITKDTLRDSSTSGELSISTFDFPRTTKLSGDTNTTSRITSLFVGSESGGVYRADGGGTGSGTSWAIESATRDNHEAAVSAMSAHPFGHRVAFLDDVVLSASEDWTIKLWYFHKSQPAVCMDTFDMVENGRVHDIAWSGQHPTMFCSGDEAGFLSLFDVSHHLSTADGQNRWQFKAPDSEEGARLTSVQWDYISRHVCAGNARGTVSLWQCTPAFASLPDAEWMGRYLKSKRSERV